LLYYRVCWQSVFRGELDIGPIDIDFPLLNFYLPSNGAGGSPITALDLPMEFFMMFIYIIICSALYKFVDWMADLSSEIILNSKVASLSAAATKTLNNAFSLGNKGLGIGVGGAYGFARGRADGGAGIGGAISGAIKGGRRGAAERVGKIARRNNPFK
jgi:hypothetical protein